MGLKKIFGVPMRYGVTYLDKLKESEDTKCQ